METDFNNISGMFKFNTDIVTKAITDISPDSWFRNPSDDSNHLMWVVGHLVVHRGHILKMMGVDWDNRWVNLFARGTERISDSDYPTPEEMTSAWQSVSDELRAALKNASEDAMAQPAPQGVPSFDTKLGGTVAFLAFHDTYHTGQVSYLRKWLGFGQAVG